MIPTNENFNLNYYNLRNQKLQLKTAKLICHCVESQTHGPMTM